MKKIFTLFLICVFSTTLFSQTSAYEKFAFVDTLLIPYTDKVDMQKSKNKMNISEADWLSYKFKNIEEYDTDYQYYVYGTAVVNGIKLLLIERKYREETNHWAVYINENKRIFSHLNIAYKNYGSFLYIESDMNEEHIIIKEHNNSNNQKDSETIYTVNTSGFYKK